MNNAASQPLGSRFSFSLLKISGMVVEIHPSFWPLLLILAIFPLTGRIVAQVPSVLFECLLGGILVVGGIGALFFYAAAQTMTLRHFGITPTAAVVLPFGVVFRDSVEMLPRGPRLASRVAGPLLALLLGSLAASLSFVVFQPLGRFSLVLGLLNLVPCWPLAGGMCVREIIKSRYASERDADQKVLEISRKCALALAVLALTCVSVWLLYVSFALWFLLHWHLAHIHDWTAIFEVSKKWFKDMWSDILRQFRRKPVIAFVIAFVFQDVGSIRSADTQERRRPTSWVLAESISNHISNHDQRISRLETNSALKETVQRLESHTGALDARLIDLLADCRGRLDEVEQRLTVQNRIRSELDQLKRDAAAQKKTASEKLNQLLSQQSSLSMRLSMFEEPLDHLQKRQLSMADLETELDRRQQAGNELILAFAANVNSIANRTSFVLFASVALFGCISWYIISNCRQRIASLESRLDSVTGPQAQLKTALSIFHQVDSNRAVACPEFRPKVVDLVTAEPVPHLKSPEINCAGPTELTRRILKASLRSRRIRVKPILPKDFAWNFGAASVKGPVRSENQDYVLAFEQGGYQVVLVADGMGGLPLGAGAAYYAVRAAVLHTVKELGESRLWHRPNPANVAEAALQAASRRLTIEGSRHRLNKASDGFRTTLIAVVASNRGYGFCYIGDGGGCIIRSTGEIEEFLKPQKAAGDAINVLAASLGPAQEGDPISGHLPRRPGDLLVCGTDGVFDRLAGDFAKRLLQGALHFQGDLQRVAEQVVNEMSVARDDEGFICDDNLTIALLGDPDAPPTANIVERLPYSQDSVKLDNEITPVVTS
jgi:serine/threonine protein phosphatase PrpC/Zn-dependent protease